MVNYSLLTPNSSLPRRYRQQYAQGNTEERRKEYALFGGKEEGDSVGGIPEEGNRLFKHKAPLLTPVNLCKALCHGNGRDE